MDIVFRTDASSFIGTGHVVRCLTLAFALQKCGCAVSFVCREHNGHLCDLIEARGFTVKRLPLLDTSILETSPAHASWLGGSWQEDANETRAVIVGTGVKP